MKIKKFDAARSQLNTAIQLWFQGADPASIHTLVYAAYEVIHVISKKRGRTGSLVFDYDQVKPKFQRKWADLVKGPANFLKHAKLDHDAEFDLDPMLTEYFIAMCIHGLHSMKEPLNAIEGAFKTWMILHQPEFLTDEAVCALSQTFDVKAIAGIKTIPKNEFLQRCIDVWGNSAIGRW